VDLFSVLDKLETGYRMPRPEGCPPEVYALMRDCWHTEPERRPSFEAIRRRLETMYGDGRSIADEVEKTLTLEKGMSLSGMAGDYTDVSDTPSLNSSRNLADASAAKKEVIGSTKRILKQVQGIVRAVAVAEIPPRLELLSTDAENLISTCRALCAGDDRVEASAVRVEQCVISLAQYSHRIRTESGPEAAQATQGAVRQLAKEAKALCDVVRQAPELSSA